ncbi:MAG: hypothetical protein HYY57_00185, partial [Candidatus Omnitrophica bacterium]|nr:hypothetical protein [Candidatus Omnitrophota bacterium]
MHPRNLFILTLISVCSGAGLGYAQGRNEVAFVSPEITQPGSGGSRVVVQPESIEAVDIATGQKRTLLADTEFVRALAFDAAGNLYFEQQTLPPPDTAREIWKLDTAGQAERVATVYSLVPGANQGADGDSVMTVNRATNEVVFVSPEITSPGAGGNRVVVQSESIEAVNIATGQQRTLVANTKFVRALAFDAVGNLYFEQETTPYPSTTREILKQDPTGQLASIATVFSLVPGLGQGADGESSIAINRATNELAFISPEITESGPQGSRIVVHPESIEMVDLGTGGQHTLVPHTALARALAYDAAGNLYFEQQTVPPPDTAREIWKLDTSGHMERLVTVYSLLPGANQGADGGSAVAYNPGQRIFLDWETPLDIVILRIPDYSTTPVSYTYPAVPQLSQTVSFSENDKDEIFMELQKIFLNSSLDLPILESRIHVLPPPMDAVRVRFAPSGAGLLGKAYEGVDQCNERRRNDNIAVFGNPPTGDLTKLMAETSAHEFGHALGLRHMDPFPISGVEVMDYAEPGPGVTEQFTEGPYEIMEDLHLPQHAPTGVFHNAVYHIRAYSLGESRASLESQNVFPGFDWDTACLGQNPSSSRHLSFVNLQYNSPIHHVLVQKEIGPTPAKAGDGPLFEDPKWETIAYLETVDPA